MEKTFIESAAFPFSCISAASVREKGPGRPPHWEMVYWWTRKPLISARAVIAASLLPENTDPHAFLQSIGVQSSSKRPDPSHKIQPSYLFDKTLLDPFSGFGSIPLEASRLGLDVTAVELLPTSYIFLKAVLEYPHQSLVEDIRKWGTWIATRLETDKRIRALYEKDVSCYVGTWEVKCPICGRFTPLVGNWWLARVKRKNIYTRLAWMEPEIHENTIRMRVVDLNDTHDVTRAKVDGLKVEIDRKTFKVPEKNVHARREAASCLLCHQPLRAESVKKWYVKYALERYNTAKEEIARPVLLVKVKGKRFEACTEEDQQRFRRAEREIENLFHLKDADIPQERISPYSVRYLFPLLYGITEWYKLFTPRQLLTLVTLVKLIREAATLVEKEKMGEGFSPEKAFDYAQRVATYLALALCKYADYNSLATYWNPSLIRAPTMAVRGIAMNWNFTDTNPTARITGSFTQNLANVLKGVRYLTEVNAPRRNLYIQLDDACTLSTPPADLIVTDPPYYDDVPYTELSDFYYVWLKRALSSLENGLTPRFLPEIFFENTHSNRIEISTQWEKYALKEVSLNPPRLSINGRTHFQTLLNQSFITMSSNLKADGLLVTYYAHTNPEAWTALLEAGWRSAGFRITGAFPLATEPAQSVVKRGKLSLDTSIVIVWRKGAHGSIKAGELYQKMVEAVSERAYSLITQGFVGRDLVMGSMAQALKEVTTYSDVMDVGPLEVKTLVESYSYPATLEGVAQALVRKSGMNSVKSDALFYLLVKVALAGGAKKMKKSDARLFCTGTSFDLKKGLTMRILTAKRGESSLVLTEPTSSEKGEFSYFLKSRGIDISSLRVRCAVDVLHFLEYHVVTSSKEAFMGKLEEIRMTYPQYSENAVFMSRIMSEILPEVDVEKELCRRIVERLETT